MRMLVWALWAIAIPAFSADAPCGKIDPSVVDPVDGMPLCPQEVTKFSAFSVFRCGLSQANSFHAPTTEEKDETRALLTTWKDIREKGKNPELGLKIRSHADKLDLQICRAIPTADNTYLLAYTKPGVKNYSGAFFILRETKASRFIVIGPHDGSDGTHTSTKLAIQNSQALALISNGHYKKNIPPNSVPDERGGKGDFAHASEKINLATFAVKVIGNELYEKAIWLHVHGMKNASTVLYRIRNPEKNRKFEKAWVKATAKATGIDKFNDSFSAGFHTDEFMSNQFIKVEYPAQVHTNRKEHLGKAISEMETYPWAWE